MEIAIAFGRVLRRARNGAGLTQEQLALEAGVQRNYISTMERGQQLPTIAVVFKLATALNVAPSELIASLERELMSA